MTDQIRRWQGEPVDIVIGGPREALGKRSDNTLWHCSKCNAEVCLAASTLEVMRRSPKATVICQKCAFEQLGKESMQQSRWKVGQRVRITDGPLNKRGRVGTVSIPARNGAIVRFDDGMATPVRDQHLELIDEPEQPPDAPLAK